MSLESENIYIGNPSKTQRKLASGRNRSFAQELLDLVPAKFEKLDLPEHIRQGIYEVRAIPSHAAKKRAMKKVEKFLEDVEIEPIRRAIAKVDHIPKAKAVVIETGAMHLADELIDGGDTALFSLADRLDRDAISQLRAIVRKVQKALQAGLERDKARKDLVERLNELGLDA